jgi:hypothetical protein
LKTDEGHSHDAGPRQGPLCGSRFSACSQLISSCKEGHEMLIVISARIRMSTRGHFGFLSVLFAAALIASMLGVPKSSFANDGNALIVKGEGLDKSITAYDEGELGPIKSVLKVWNETYDARSHFDILLYGYFPQIRNPGRLFFQAIKIFDGKTEVQIHDWDSADCSLEKMMLIKSRSSVYLVLAHRSSKENSTEIISQNAPAPEVLRLFELTEVGKAKNEYGKSHIFFQKTAERKTTEGFCGADEIYSAMQKFADEAMK